MKRNHQQSQNFLRSPSLVLEMIGHTTIKKTDTVLDIGAGSGVISAALAKRAAKVIAYEFDARLIEKLHDNLKNLQNVTVVNADFLQSELPSTPYKIFSNIPFHLSSPILKKLTESSRRPDAINLIVQKQFAHKLLIDKPGFTGLLGAQIAPMYTARIRKKLQRTDFYPYPAVDTVLIELKRREQLLVPEERLPAYREFTSACFSDPKVFVKMPRRAANVSEELKPSQLSTEQWVSLFSLQQRF